MDSQKNKFIVIDLETEGLDRLKDKILLVGFSLDGKTVYQFRPQEEKDNEIIKAFERYVADGTIRKIGHNPKFDVLFLLHNGYHINGRIDDTAILSYLENPFSSVSLKDLAEQKLKRKVKRLEDIETKVKKKHREYFEKSNKYWKINNKFYLKTKIEEYNRADVLNCYTLKQETIETEWYKKVEQPLIEVLIKTEDRGIQLDVPHLEKLKIEYEKETNEIQSKFTINLRSPQQIAKYLKEQGFILKEKTEKGQFQTGRLVLKRLLWDSPQNSDLILILRYKELYKLYSTYILPLLCKRDKYDRIHGSFNQAGKESADDGASIEGTRTGRLTSSEPNLQNIPDRTEEGRKIRMAFIPSSGNILIVSDLKQIEPRLIAHYTQAPKLLNAYVQGLDTHGMFAADIFGKDIKDLTKMERFIGKTSWLATFYGCWYKKLKVIAETYSEEPIPYDEEYFNTIQRNFWKANPELENWRQIHIRETQQNGYLQTIGGRRIKIIKSLSSSKYNQSETERQAVNYLIQGSAADVIKTLLVRLSNVFEAYGNEAHILATVHDEILVEAPSESYKDLVHDIMESTFTLKNVKVEADTKIIENWSEK